MLPDSSAGMQCVSVTPNESDVASVVYLLSDKRGGAHFPEIPALDRFNDPAVLTTRAVPGALIIIDSGTPAYQTQCIWALRRADSTVLLPVFVTHNLDELAFDLSDGVVSSIGEARALAAPIHRSLQRLKGGQSSDSADLTVLWYYGVRPKKLLAPVRRWDHRSAYVYPLLHCLDENIDAPAWLSRLGRQGLMESAGFIDRVRLCPECDSAHLNYIDFCVKCQSRDLSSVSMLHCFRCGHIGAESSFTSEHKRVCPKCKERLRHLGSDFDYALTTAECMSCGLRNTEAPVVAACLECNTSTDITRLQVRQITSWKLTDLGRSAAFSSNMYHSLAQGFASSDAARSVTLYQTLEWLQALRRSISQIDFTVMHLSLKGANFGDSAAADFHEGLTAALTPADVLIRTGPSSYFIAIPHGPNAFIPAVREKIEALCAATGVDFKLNVLGSAEIPATFTATQIIEYASSASSAKR